LSSSADLLLELPDLLEQWVPINYFDRINEQFDVDMEEEKK
jgi:hypothetical protein